MANPTNSLITATKHIQDAITHAESGDLDAFEEAIQKARTELGYAHYMYTEGGNINS